jgi:polyhydroxybutyrate depolymerase
MKWLKILFVLLLVVISIIAGLYFYFLYAPKVDKPLLAGEYNKSTVSLDELSRSFSWYKPQALSKSAPLIFVLHGSNASGDKIRSATAYEFDLLAEQHGFIVVYPDGYKNYWNDCRASADYAANTENINDVAFFKFMIDYFDQQKNINQQQVFVTGMSNGGHMAFRLAFEVPELFSAFAPMAANLPVDSNFDCKKTGQAVSVAVFNGSDDLISPYGGGLVVVSGNASRGEVISTIDTVNYWRDLAGIDNEAVEKTFPEVDGLQQTSVIEQRWFGDDNKQVRLYTLQGSGHVIPSKMTRAPRILGERVGDISGPEEIVDFFLFPDLK